MLSRRSSVARDPNRWAEAVRQARAAGRSILDLTSGNPTAVGIDYPQAEILTALSDPRALTYRPEPFGIESARSAVAGAWQAAGVDVAWQRVLLTASTSEAYSYLFKLLCDPGDQVLVPTPSYPLLEHLARLDSVELRPYFIRYDGGWHVDPESVRSALGPRVRAIVAVSPNNPTGSVLDAAQWAALSELGLPLISDEVFAGFPLTGDRTRTPSALEATSGPVFVLDGLSKRVGLPQAKLGWITCSGPDAWVDEAIARLELICDTYLSVGTPVQLALPRLLELGGPVRQAIRERCTNNLRALQQLCAGSVLTPLPVEAGWYGAVRLPRVQSEEEWVVGLLEQDGVLVQPGWFFDFAEEPYAVLSLLTPERDFADGVERLVERAEAVARS